MTDLSRRRMMIAATGAAALATPAIAQGPRVLRMVTSWPASLSGLGDSVRRCAEGIEAASGGAVKVEVYPPGALVGALAVHDAVSAGEADLYHSAEYYFPSKHPAFPFFTTVPMGMTAAEQVAWTRRGGGQELWDELNARFGVKALPAGGTGTQMGGWFVKPIETLEDLRETVMRMPGLGAAVLRRLNVKTVLLPAGGIVAALQAGEIGAMEWVGPWNDLQFGFQKLLSTYMYPGFHEPGSTLSLGVNLAVWNGMGDELRSIVETVSLSECALHTSHYGANNAFALRSLRDEYGVQPTRMPDEVVDVIARTAREVVAEVAEFDELSRRIYESYTSFLNAAAISRGQQDTLSFLEERARNLGI